jgi:hypothetical protein
MPKDNLISSGTLALLPLIDFNTPLSGCQVFRPDTISLALYRGIDKAIKLVHEQHLKNFIQAESYAIAVNEGHKQRGCE